MKVSQDDYRVASAAHYIKDTHNLVDRCYHHKQTSIVPSLSPDSLIIHDSELGRSVHDPRLY